MNEIRAAEAPLTPSRIAALSARLQSSPRDVLALTAHLARNEPAIGDRAALDIELTRLRGNDAARIAVDLLLLGYGSYALDDIDRALALVWSDIDVGL